MGADEKSKDRKGKIWERKKIYLTMKSLRDNKKRHNKQNKKY